MIRTLLSNSNKTKQIGFIFAVLLCLFIFISKSAIDIALVIILLISFADIYLYNRDIVRNNRYLIYFLVPVAAGLILNVLSAAGIGGSFKFLERFRFLLTILPLAVFVTHRKQFKLLYMATLVSAVISLVYGVLSVEDQFFERLRGFLIIGRTADMLMMIVLLNIVILCYANPERIKKHFRSYGIITLLTAFFIWAMLMTSIRGAWLGFFFGIAVLALCYRRKLILILIPLILCLALMVSYTDVKILKKIAQQAASIIEANDPDTRISNSLRFHLWTTGLAFSRQHFLFGTGADNTETLFLDFFASHSDAYQQKYHWAKEHPNEFHNSYLQILIENGVIFFMIYIFSIFGLIYKLLSAEKKAVSEDQQHIVAGIVVSSGFLVSQFFHSDLYSYGSCLYYLILYNALFAANKYVNWLPRRIPN